MAETFISLTSTPGRFTTLGPVLESLLTQGADRVILALPGDPPPLPQGVEVLACEDIGPACKILPARAAFPRADIIYCDDDCLYGPGWLDALTAASGVTAASSFPISRLKRQGGLVAQGFAGVRVPANVPLAATIPNAIRDADDLWLSAHFETITEIPAARALVTPLDLPGGLQRQNRAEIYRAACDIIWKTLGVWPAA